MEAVNSLGALGFWLFIAAIVVAGIWSDVRKREIQQETLRRIVESGKEFDAAMLDKMVEAGGGKERAADDLKTAGIIMLSIAPGLAVLGWFMSSLAVQLLSILLGVSLLVAFLGVGLLVAGKVSERGYRESQG